MTPAERSSLRDHVLAEGLAGDTRTPRENVVSNALKLAAGDPDKGLGFSFEGLDPNEVMEAVAALCGCSPSLDERDGPGYIAPERTLDELGAAADRLIQAASRSERILCATGHPAGLLPLYQGVARALAEAGCAILSPRSGERIGTDPLGRRRDRIRYLEGVACLTDGASLYHTHEAWPMESLLEAAEVPDLVVADHGFAGAAISAGLETLAIADVNDPALSVAKARRLTDVVVPLDDNLPPDRYVPLVRFLVTALGTAGGGGVASAHQPRK